jgi:hypothetical protein
MKKSIEERSMFKKLFITSLIAMLSAASVAYAAVVSLTVPYTVASTTPVNVPGIELTNVQCTSLSFMGGLYLGWACPAVLTVKDANVAGLKTQLLFGTSVATAYQETVNADGSVTRVFVIHNPKGINSSGKITVKAQLGKVSANVVIDPTVGDVLSLSSN